MKCLLSILEHVVRAGKPLLLVAEKVQGEALALVANKLRCTHSACAVKVPALGRKASPSNRFMNRHGPSPTCRSAVLAAAICCVPGPALFLGGCSAGKDAGRAKVSASIDQRKDVQPAAEQTPRIGQTHVEMVNVNIHLDPALILRVHYLSGQFLPTRKGHPLAFDDKRSYIVAIDSAEVGVSAASMSHALNTYVFDTPDAPLKNLTLSIEGNQIKQTGILNKGIGIPFEMTGTMSATADGRIRIQPTQMKAAHLPVKGVMKLLGLDMAKLINTFKTKGMSVDGNDIILDPAQMLPPPMMRGQITAISIRGDEIVQTFGAPRRVRAGEPFGGNYMWYRGGVLQFGKLTMNDTDMRLIDADPTDPFDFFPDHYEDQLVAGYSKTTATGGLLVYMPDYGKISTSLSPHLAEVKAADRTTVASGLR
jgi:hypothetical protein